MRLLIIGESSEAFNTARDIAVKKGVNVRHINSIEIALDTIRAGQGADLIMIDVKYDIGNLIRNLLTEHIHIPVIACGSENNTKSAIAAIKAGAKEYITLPPNEELIISILESLTSDPKIIISKSAAMEEVFTMANQVAPSDANILVTGESGTGKEIISKYIHDHSKRSSGSFISVNCAAIPENLIESELFGHEKGAFTGAIARRIGKFEESNGGTLLLDEISEIDIKLQAKLLRAIQEREIDRIGGSKPIKLNLRIIATSNRDLLKEVRENRFREDLYFRLNIINLKLPRLIERKEDIIDLAYYFIKKYSTLNQLPVKELSEDSLNLIMKYSWPGNIRELENTIYRAILLSNSQYIETKDLMLRSDNSDNKFIAKTVETVERDYILDTLNHCLGDRISAANILGISIKVLRNKLNAYTSSGIKVPHEAE